MAGAFDRSMQKAKILAIDDDPVSTRVTKVFLEKVGRYEVQELNVPALALEVARDYRPDLVLLDVTMPGLDGGAVAQQLESEPSLAGVPIVFFTGAFAEEAVAGNHGMWGGMRFLTKPMRPKVMVATLDEALAEAREVHGEVAA